MSESASEIPLTEMIAVVGLPSVGKSGFSALLADSLGGTHVSFGDVYRAAKERDPSIGLSISEQIKIGRAEVVARTVPLVRDMLYGHSIVCASGPMVLDFHPPTEDALEQLGARPIHTFFLNASKDTRLRRELSRKKYGAPEEDLRATFQRRTRLYQNFFPIWQTCETLQRFGAYHVINAERPLDEIVPQALDLYLEARAQRLALEPSVP